MPSRLSARALARRHVVIAFFAIAIPAATILPFVPALPAEASSTPTLLGEQSFYTMDTHQLWDKANLAVNVASGDLIFHDTTLQLAGFAGHNLDLDLYYNSLSNGAGGGADFGSDWVMTAGSDVKLTIGSSITYQGPSSFQQVFTSNGSGGWTTAAGMDATLAGPNGSGNYTLTYHDNGQVLTFNSSGQLIDNADRNGNTFAYAYNTGSLAGTLHQITDASGRTVTFSYNGGGNVSSYTESGLGRTYTFTINGSHNLVDYYDAMSSTSNPAVFTYDTSGHHELVQIQDPAGGETTKLTYDSNHRVIGISYVDASAPGGSYNRTFTYNSGTTGSNCSSTLSPAGNTVVLDENGNTITYCWDSSGRVIQQIDGLGHSNYTTWNSDDKPTAITDANGNTTTNTYDTTGEKLTQIQQPTESVTGAITKYTYGSTNNPYAPSTVQNPDGSTINYAYYSNGNLQTMTNGRSSQNTIEYAPYSDGELFGVLDAAGDATSICSNVGDPITQCHNYDSNGALTESYNPSSEPGVAYTSDSFANDGASRMTQTTDANGKVTTYQYDADGRVTAILYNGITSLSGCPTPPSVDCTTFSHDADGNLQSMSDQTGTTTYGYDPLNRLTSESESLTGSQTCTTTPMACTSYTFDGVGNITTITNGLGASNIIHYGYDAAYHLLKLWLGPSSATTCGSMPSTCTSFTVDYDGNRTGTAYPNAVGLLMNYDASDRLYQVESQNGSGNLTVWSYTYTDPSGQDTNLRYTANQSVSPPSSWSNSYDPLDNLTQSDSLSYAYNGAADLCGTSCSTPSMTYYPSTALDTWNSYTYGYDGDGNMKTITGGGANVSLSYNVQNQLGENCNNSTCASYSYRGVGQADRASATGSYGTQTWSSDAVGVSTETNTQSVGCPCYYVHDNAGGLVEEILTTGSTAGTYYPIFDGEGSVVALTNSSAAVVDTFSYSPLGVVTPGSSNSVYEPWQFQGEYADQSQSNYMPAAYQYHDAGRFYEAGQMNGHFTQADPQSSPTSTGGWNSYSYAGSDSANLSDANGLDACNAGPDAVCLLPYGPAVDTNDLCLWVAGAQCDLGNGANFFEVESGGFGEDGLEQLILIALAVGDCGASAAAVGDITVEQNFIPGVGFVSWLAVTAGACALGGATSYFLGYNLLSR